MRKTETRTAVILSLLVVGIIIVPALAHAHGNTGDNGFISGLRHPVFGPDHLIAMVTVGLLSAQIGGSAIWTVPSTFVIVMVLGGMLGLKGISLPLVEYGIAVSVLALGIALAAARRLPVALAMVFVGIFAIFHGHAHGTEMPRLAEPALYAVGFSLATAGLHIVGAVTGYLAVHNTSGARLLRLAGFIIALSGTYFVMQV